MNKFRELGQFPRGQSEWTQEENENFGETELIEFLELLKMRFHLGDHAFEVWSHFPDQVICDGF